MWWWACCPHPGPPPLTQGREFKSPPLRSGGGLGWGQASPPLTSGTPKRSPRRRRRRPWSTPRSSSCRWRRSRP
ncbi:hypothetical protein TSH58p_21770 (plasmid) [Azospirillum sp. TSH58]|nr:hypothetical protein TSH58p_21770 [Azospirillum sp. TSH58]